MRTVWFVGGGIEAVAGIRRAREMGLRVAVSDGDPNAPGFAEAHHRHVASTYDIEETRRAALGHRSEVGRIHGVLSVAVDVPVTVAALAQSLGVPGISQEAAELSADKLAMKRRFAADGIPVPWFRPVRDAQDLRAIVNERGPALVLKPVDSRGARGVIWLESVRDLDWAVAHALENSPTRRIMVEAYVEGPQLSSESLMVDGVAHTPCLADRNYEHLERFAPHIIEDGGDLPSALPSPIQSAVRGLVERAALSLGVRDGVAKGDVVVGPEGPCIIEMASRLSGGYLCTHEIPVCTGVDFVGNAIRVALGERPDAADLRPTVQRSVCQRWLFASPGQVLRVTGLDAARRVPGVFFVESRVAPGDVIQALQSHRSRSGLVMAEGATRHEARERAGLALAAIRVEMAPGESRTPDSERSAPMRVGESAGALRIALEGHS